MPLFLTERDVQALVGWDDMPEAIDRIEHAYREKAAGRATCFAAIDNLWKGAAGQAVQNLNLMLGIDERSGLAGGQARAGKAGHVAG